MGHTEKISDYELSRAATSSPELADIANETEDKSKKVEGENKAAAKTSKAKTK